VKKNGKPFFSYAFTPEQVVLLVDMLFSCGGDWRREWQDFTEDAVLAVQAEIYDTLVPKTLDTLANHHEAIVGLRSKMEVVSAAAFSAARSSREVSKRSPSF
jgi:hypothetical protein